jgi:hypothetical protein
MSPAECQLAEDCEFCEFPLFDDACVAGRLAVSCFIDEEKHAMHWNLGEKRSGRSVPGLEVDDEIYPKPLRVVSYSEVELYP